MLSHLTLLPNVTNRGTHSLERIMLDLRNREKWLLDMGAERVLLFKRKYAGTRCPNYDPIRKRDAQHGQDTTCFGTGFVGGYFKPVEIMTSLLSGAPEQQIIQEAGRQRVYTPHSWTLWEPLLSNGDAIVRYNNQRFWITSVTQRRWRKYLLHQDFETAEIERNHPIYQLGI